MKKALLIATLFLSSTLIAANVDTGKSNVEWVGKKVTGQHKGTIAIKKADLKMKGDQLTGGMIVIDMTTINTTDLSGDMKAKLDGHLNSPDFFNTAEHKTAELTVTNVKSLGKGKYKVMGDLVIKGKKNPTSFTVTQKGKNFTGKLVFDRTKYGVKYGSGSFFDDLGDKMIYDDVELTFKLAMK